MELANAVVFDEAATRANMHSAVRYAVVHRFRRSFRQRNSGAGMEEFFNSLLGQSAPCVRWLLHD
jgi:hypothetical protein